jgi:hypothetical protein
MFSEQKELLYGYPSDIEYHNRSVGIADRGCNSPGLEDPHQRPSRENPGPTGSGPRRLSLVTWLILPVVICLSQRLSHACLSINNYTVKLRMAH